MRSIYTSLFLAACFCASNAQTISNGSTVSNNLEAASWSDMMQDPHGNFYSIQNSFNAYWQGRDVTEKGKGYKAFKRWEYFTERRVYPSGDLAQLNLTAKNFQDWLNNNGQNIYQGANNVGKVSTPNNMIASTTWTAIGPMGPLSGNAGGQLLKSGRINFVSVSPTNSNVLFVGAPCGGLWRSTNGGANWTTNTDNLPVIGFGDHAFDPTNTNIMYAANGDGDAGDSYCTNVYKSTDGGTTWNTTGLSFAVTAGVRIRRLIVNPTNPQIVMAVGSMGIRRSTDGGATWTSVSTTNTYDIEFMPGNPSIVYAGGTTFRRSTDGGVTWTTIAGVPASGTSNRLAIAVTPANANFVYVLASNSSGSGFLGFLQSTNSGVSFANITTTLNLLGWSNAGTDTGGQGWYDLCIAASPTNAAEVVVGGVNVWRTTNAGASWSIYGHWTGSGAPFTHADQHDLEFASNGTLFNSNDGTVYRRTATTWQEISGTMNVSQIYKIGLSGLSNLWITGHQDNGTSSWNGTTYTARLGGDGMDCFIDRTNDNNMFGEYQNGSFQKSTNGGLSWTGCTTGMSGATNWVTVWKQDPTVAARLYAGRQNMFVSNNSATSWTILTALPATGAIIEFAIAPSNNQVLYVVKSNNIFKTVDGGNTWSTITGTIPVASAGLQNVCVSPTDANKVWVCSGNYSTGNKVWYSNNGGTTWTNWSSNLPNIPANCLVYETGSTDRVYVGMDIGVYYRDPSAANWTLYNTGLPNMPLSDMETSPAQPGKIVAATYGRGVWVVDFAPNALPPVTSFAYTGTLCAGVPKVFNDNSTNGPSSWVWSVAPSTGVTINTPSSQTPTITFANAGNYVVSMTASNTSGPGNTYTLSVTVNPTPTITIAASANTICAGSPVTFTASGASSYSWACPTSSVCTYFPSSTTTYSFAGTSAAGCSGVGTRSVAVQPSITVNTAATSTSICAPQSVTLSATGATTYTWQPGNLIGSAVVVSPSANTTYTVTGASGVCNNIKTVSIIVGSSLAVSAASSTNAICGTQPVTLTASGATNYTWQPGNLSGASVVVNPSSSTTYSVNGATGSCNGNTVLAITVNQNPNVSAVTSSTLICAGTAATITAFGASTYSWSTGATTQTIAVFPVLSTTYAVTGYSNGCSTTFTMVQNVAWCTTLAEFNLGAENYKAYPNPFADEIKFSASEEVEVTMYDELGKVIKRSTFKGEGTLATSDLPGGVYLVFMKGQSGVKTLRLLKNKN
jgi:hypothetical protein